MRSLRWWTLLFCFASAAAWADVNDLETYRLGCPAAGTCASLLGSNPAQQAQLNDDNFRIFAREFAAGLTSTNLMPPSSLGQSGFSFNAELSVVNFSPAQ